MANKVLIRDIVRTEWENFDYDIYSNSDRVDAFQEHIENIQDKIEEYRSSLDYDDDCDDEFDE